MEGLRNFLESIIGRQLTKKTFWFFATIFIFILATNWFGLIPGVGTIGWGHRMRTATSHITTPLLRGANADLNMTLAMSLIFFACWIVWAMQSNGFGGSLLHIFGPKGETNGFMKVLMVVVFAVVGLLEVVSIAFRPVSLSFRLYGNIFAGENMLEAMSKIVPALAPAHSDSVLLHGAAGRPRAGARLHAADRGLHAAHLLARRGAARRRTASLSISSIAFGRQTMVNRGGARETQNQ